MGILKHWLVNAPISSRHATPTDGEGKTAQIALLLKFGDDQTWRRLNRSPREYVRRSQMRDPTLGI